MYYEIGEIIRKNIHVNGFDFKLFILKGHMGISIQVKDMNNVPIKHAYVVDENDLDMASELFNQNNKGLNYLLTVLKNWNKEGVSDKESAENKLKPRNTKKETTDDVIAQMEKELSDN
ncbi:Hypothetical protein SaO17_00281 [Staphylococcus aureus]|nr:DUF1108 family protein [Staphylococcus aureus]AXU07490.1 Hypothetical protein SaO17_00281 [Staphylococcus aureus]